MLADDEENEKLVDLPYDIEEMEKPEMYSFADLKTFKIVNHNPDTDSDFQDSDTLTDDSEAYDDANLPLKDRTRRTTGRQVKGRLESTESLLNVTQLSNKKQVQPLVYEMSGGFYDFLIEKVESFMNNHISENVLLSSILLFICN